jgi:hypothetical protein
MYWLSYRNLQCVFAIDYIAAVVTVYKKINDVSAVYYFHYVSQN